MSSVVLRSIASTHKDAGEGDGLGAALDADMQHLLATLRALGPKRLERCDGAEEARRQPGLATALDALVRDRREEPGVGMEMRLIPGADGDIRARVYRPADTGTDERLPMILHLHGGGGVVGDLDGTAATPRALAARCRAIVVAAHCRQAPEFGFPAAHEDARAAWAWMIAETDRLGGDPGRTAIVGEDFGANLAVDAAIGARGSGGVRPRHLALVAPMALVGGLPEDDEDLPVGASTIGWFRRQTLREGQASDDTRLDPAGRADLGGLPPTTVILARHDPLLGDGERLAAALRRAGVWVDATVYEGVTHGFFGLARVVNKAVFAQGQVVRNLNESLR